MCLRCWGPRTALDRARRRGRQSELGLMNLSGKNWAGRDKTVTQLYVYLLANAPRHKTRRAGQAFSIANWSKKTSWAGGNDLIDLGALAMYASKCYTLISSSQGLLRTSARRQNIEEEDRGRGKAKRETQREYQGDYTRFS